MSELKLKSETVRAPKVMLIESVRTREPVQFLGVNGSQISQAMSGHIFMEWNADQQVVVITSSTSPGKAIWLYPANISHIVWKEIQ